MAAGDGDAVGDHDARGPDEAARPEEAAAVRQRALAAATSAYAATYGHPLEHSTGTGPVRWGTSARTAVVVASTLALLACGVVIHTLAGAPGAVVVAGPVSPAPPTAGGGAVPAGDHEPVPAPDGDGSPGGHAPPADHEIDVVLVHVVGRVHEPGVVELPAGSRVVDAVTAAGGPTAEADLSLLNLARPVVDGEQVLVPRPGEQVPPEASGAGTVPASPGGPGRPGDVLDVNRATAAELEALPGIGPVLAARIVAHRDQQGAFGSVDDLQAVRGIGPSLLADLRDRVTT